MSSTRGGEAIDASNLFVTPAWATDAVLPHLPIGGLVVDAGCGEGAILTRVAKRMGSRGTCRGIEIDPGRASVARSRMDEIRCGGDQVAASDWLTWGDSLAELPQVNLAIFNPPFILAQPFIERALLLAAPVNGTVAVLLRANWSIPACRADFANAHPFDLAVLRKRCDFVASLKCGATPRCMWKKMQAIEAPRPKVCPGCGGKVIVVTTDSSDYAWHIFGPGRGGRFFALDIPREAEPLGPAIPEDANH